MLNYIWPVIIIISFIYAIISGNINEINNSIFTSLEDVISLCTNLVGNMCLWCGLIQIIKKTSLINKLKRILNPIIKKLFPDTKYSREATENISINIISNLLGIGNAATPSGIKAMEELQKINKNKNELSDTMMMFIVLNTTSIQLIPTTIISIRASLGSNNPSNIIIPIWISTIAGTIMGILATKILIKKRRENK